MGKRFRLQERHQAFLVKAFACYCGPSEARDALKEEFGIEVSVPCAAHYNAERRVGVQLHQKWRDLFAEARKAFISDVVAEVPLAQKSLRIKELAKAATKFKSNNNYIAMARMLEQIAKEVGNVHTNRHEITGKDGGAIKYQDVGDMTDDQIDEELRRLTIIPMNPDIHPAPDKKQ